jgi:hypothetical protein
MTLKLSSMAQRCIMQQQTKHVHIIAYSTPPSSAEQPNQHKIPAEPSACLQALPK